MGLRTAHARWHEMRRKLVQSEHFVHYAVGRGYSMIRASRVGGDRAAPDGGNGEMGAVVDLAQVLELELAYQVAPDGQATVRVRGELDIATADQAYTYLRDVVDGQDGPVTVNLSELSFCDAAGLGVLARVAGALHVVRRSITVSTWRSSTGV